MKGLADDDATQVRELDVCDQDLDASLIQLEREARESGHQALLLSTPHSAEPVLISRGYLPVAQGWWRRVQPLSAGVNRDVCDTLQVTAEQHGTLLFVQRAGQLLLIHKRRGHGAGQVNGPGGRREAGETPLAAAIRELWEETGVTPRNVRRAGSIRFVDADGSTMIGHIYRAQWAAGRLRHNAEALPFWCVLDAIPYGRMWADDRLWLPWMLQGRYFDLDILTRGDEIAGQFTRSLM